MRCASETKTEQAAIETRRTAGFDDFEALLVVPVQQLVRQRRSVLHMSAPALRNRDADNSDELVRQNASHGHGGLKGFEPGSFALPGLSFCGNYPGDMLVRLKTSLRTLENDQIKPLSKYESTIAAFE